MGRKRREPKPVDTIWTVPDWLWREVLEPLLLEFYPPAPTGRPRADLRRVLDGILYQLRTGCQWNHLPAEFGSDGTVHRWFQRFVRDGVFETAWAALVDHCDSLGGVDWQWQAADGVLGKARMGGTKSAKTPRIGASRAASAAC
jgi:putative transposase